MDDMYKSSSAAERGTLYHTRNVFHHRSVKKNVMEGVEHVQHLMNFVTDGGIGLLALKLLNVDTIDAVRAEGDPKEFIHDLATKIVNYVWPSIDEESFGRVGDGGADNNDEDDDSDTEDGKLFCTCQSSTSDGMYL